MLFCGSTGIGLVFWSIAEPLSHYAVPPVGVTPGTIEAIDFSEYFPSGTIIGSIESFELNKEGTMYNCTVRLAADMSRISNVILVDNLAIDEVRRLKREPAPAQEQLDMLPQVEISEE